MKKFPAVLVFLLVLFSSVFCVRAVQAETISDEILDQAKTQADLFLELKNALGLEWLDEYNAYLQDPVVNPAPAWETSVISLINKNYLSATFPTDFTITIVGSEAEISRDITNQAIRDAISIYIPTITTVGDTVSLLVQRPAQWVTYEAALDGKVDRDGSGDPDILPGASLDFASGSSINFLSNDGKLLGINSLVYKGEEADIRFVNAAGDNMTGQLTINGNKVWHAGNDGSGSGLDADLLDGKDSSFFTNASNLASGIVPVARLSGTYSIDISGNAATATNANYATSAGNADTVDGKHASDFALSGHTHGQYVQKSGDTMTGNLSFNSPSNVGIVGNPNTWTKIDPNGQRFIVTIPGSLTDGNPNFPVIDLERTDNWQHLWELKANGDMTVRGNPVWHAGNDGHGSGLDADTLDGKHLSEISGGGINHNGTKIFSSSGTWTKNPGTTKILVRVWGGGGGGGGLNVTQVQNGDTTTTVSSFISGSNGGTSSFGNYVYAYGGKTPSQLFNQRSPATGEGFVCSLGGDASGGDKNLSGRPGKYFTLPVALLKITFVEQPGTPSVPIFYQNKEIGQGGLGGGTKPTNDVIAVLSFNYGGCGGGGGYAEKWLDVSSISSVPVTVGAGGSGGGGSHPGYNGQQGLVIVEEFK